MSDDARERLSKRLSWALRHRPDAIGVVLSAGGWAAIEPVLAGLGMERDALDAIVGAKGRRRFEIEGDRIRALHGHSIDVGLDHAPTPPPALLFHGTIARSLRSIAKSGLARGRRTHVHLSSSEDEARSVGGRRGAPIVLRVRARALHEEHGVVFRHSPASTIWLVDHVPAPYVVFPEVR